MAGPHGSSSKTKLSKNLLQMKFMKRCTVKADQVQNEEERQRVIDDEHWVLDIPELKQKENNFITEPSLVPIEDLKFGRMSFKGFNPELEKLVKRLETEGELAASEEREKMNSVDDEEMANRYESLVGTIAKKFTKKRQRSSAKDVEEEERDSVKRKKSKKEFMKPSDD